LFLVFSQYASFKNNQNAILQVNGRIFGKLNEIQIPSIAISIGKTTMVGSGSITGLPDTDKAYFDFDIKELVSTAKDVNDFLPKETIPNSINLPASFNAKELSKEQ
jgi:hypothetical protein